jgi:hypothetical protein
MGFMDKAKKFAEQAQEKIDEAQKKFNENQQARAGDASSGPATEYDKHGRPADQPEQFVAPPEAPVSAPTEAPVSAPTEPAGEAAPKAPKPPTAPVDDPSGPAGDDRDAPPKMSHGDPLAG